MEVLLGTDSRIGQLLGQDEKIVLLAIAADDNNSTRQINLGVKGKFICP
jgi:hypothetical protein